MNEDWFNPSPEVKVIVDQVHKNIDEALRERKYAKLQTDYDNLRHYPSLLKEVTEDFEYFNKNIWPAVGLKGRIAYTTFKKEVEIFLAKPYYENKVPHLHSVRAKLNQVREEYENHDELLKRHWAEVKRLLAKRPKKYLDNMTLGMRF